MPEHSFIARPSDLILITGATGFIGRRVVKALLDLGFSNLRCLARPSSNKEALNEVLRVHAKCAQVEVMTGNLLSPQDCVSAAKGVKVVFHLAAGRGAKSFPDAFLNSVVTTRNLLDACISHADLRRFVNTSSFAVYSNYGNPRRGLLDESSPVEGRPEQRGNAYCFAKTEQDKLVIDYSRRFGVPYILIRPGYVCGPGNPGIHSRVGIDTFGIFLHLGGGNKIPVTYVDNCAEAMALAGLEEAVDGEVFNVVDDDLPSSRTFLRMYKRQVKSFHSIYVPHALSYLLCSMWEWYSKWSQGQLPPAYNRKAWRASWKRTKYSNAKLKTRVGWNPSVPMNEALLRHFEGSRGGAQNA
jgi:nucleoside-diphosphate-sugar epimerase